MEEVYYSERLETKSLEKQPGERCGKWGERLLIAIVNATKDASAEHATEDEDRYGTDVWIGIEGVKEAIPVDLTLQTDPEILEKKRANARKIGYVVFEATNKSGISITDLHRAALGGIEFQQKVLSALNEAIRDQEKELNRPFIAKGELADLIAREERGY